VTSASAPPPDGQENPQHAAAGDSPAESPPLGGGTSGAVPLGAGDAPKAAGQPSRPSTPPRNTNPRAEAGAADEFDGNEEERAAAEEAVRRVRGDFSSRAAFGDYTEFHGPGFVYRAESINLHFSPGAGPGPRKAGPLTPAALAYLRDTFVSTSSAGQLAEGLQAPQGWIQVLTGKPGSGRSTSALHALDERTGAGSDRVWVLDPQTSLADLRADDLKPDYGYVLDTTGHEQALDSVAFGQVREQLSSRDAYLVIIAESVRDPRHFEGHLVKHSNPSLTDVFSKHLAHLGDALSEAERDRMALELDGLTYPRYAVSLAEALATELSLGHDIKQVLAGYWKLLAKEEFRRADNLARRCFLLACAVVDGLPSGEVARAGFDLDSRLQRAEKPWQLPSRIVFDQELSGWWPDFVDIRSGPDPGQPDAPAPIADRLVVRNRALTGALLTLAWTEHPAAQLKLLAWLRDLAGGGRPARGTDLIRRAKVAWAVGTLARLDFDTVYQEVMERWLKPGTGSATGLHRTVAWSLAVAAQDRPLSSHVKRRIERWSRSPDQAQLMAAATAYGDRIAGISPREALDGLSRMARYLHQYSPLCDALRQLCADGEAAAVLDELAKWVQEEGSLRQAATTAMVGWLAYIPDAPGLLLLNRLAQSQVSTAALTSVWRAALGERRTADQAARGLVRWMEEVAKRSSPDGELRRVLAEITRDGTARDRLMFHAKVRLIRNENPAALVLLREVLRPDDN
jgi:hypothetical protein